MLSLNTFNCKGTYITDWVRRNSFLGHIYKIPLESDDTAKEPYISAKKPCVYATHFCKKNMYRCINIISTDPSQFLPCAAPTTTIEHAYRQYVIITQILEHKSPIFLKKKALCI